MVRQVLMGFAAACYGVLASAGVFTVLAAVGLIPRFAGKTHTGKYVLLYEEMVVAGTIRGCILSMFAEYIQVGAWLRARFPQAQTLLDGAAQAALGAAGLFMGMFVGCLALAIAEMLDSIPIFTRRVSFRHGIGLVVIGIAVGKMLGSLWYFYLGGQQ